MLSAEDVVVRSAEARVTITSNSLLRRRPYGGKIA